MIAPISPHATFVLGDRLLVVHERELLLMDPDLSVVWRAAKYLDDAVLEVTEDGARIENEHTGESWLRFDGASR